MGKVILINMDVDQLLEYLDKTYPPQCVTATDTLATANRKAGRRELIDNLIARVKREKEKYAVTTKDSV